MNHIKASQEGETCRLVPCCVPVADVKDSVAGSKADPFRQWCWHRRGARGRCGTVQRSLWGSPNLGFIKGLTGKESPFRMVTCLHTVTGAAMEKIKQNEQTSAPSAHTPGKN